MKHLIAAAILTVYFIPNSLGAPINPWGYPTLAECTAHLADVQKVCGAGQMPVSKAGEIIVLHRHIPVYSRDQMTVTCAPAAVTACVAK